MKRRKPRAARKEEQIRVRLTVEQKQKLTEAAGRASLDVSTWLRAVGLREAERLTGAESK
jgi:hypothetical protein